MWNFVALEYKSEKALKFFTQYILERPDLLNELDVANCLTAYAHFEYLDYDILEILLKQAIRTAAEMKIFSLSTINYAFSRMDITNATLIDITKQILERNLFGDSDRLSVQDCAQFQNSYIMTGMFYEYKILMALEAAVLDKMERGEVDAHTTANVFNAHAHWASHMVEECIVKKVQPMKRFHDFWRYNDRFYEKCATNLAERGDELGIRSTMLVLMNGMVTHLKRHAQIRIMYKFMIKGVARIDKEREHIGGDLDEVCILYFTVGQKYCHGKEQLRVLKQ